MWVRIGAGLTILLGAALLWSLMSMDVRMSPELIQTFAHRQLEEKLRDADYLRYEPNVVMDTGYNNRHVVSGRATAIRIGRSSKSRIPTTEFQSISYALIIAVTCSSVMGDCLEVEKIQVRGLSNKKPMI